MDVDVDVPGLKGGDLSTGKPGHLVYRAGKRRNYWDQHRCILAFTSRTVEMRGRYWPGQIGVLHGVAQHFRIRIDRRRGGSGALGLVRRHFGSTVEGRTIG